MQQRRFLPVFLLSVLLAACAGFAPQRDPLQPPIVFVHGAYGDASLWMTTLWRFESNGWPRDRLFAVDLPYPRPGADYDKPQPGRTTAAEHTAHLATEVERVRKLTGADRVILVANSRGGLAARDYIRSGQGKTTVSHAILGGTPNHGLWRNKDFTPNHEGNGLGPYLTALNSPQGPDGLEVTPGVAFMTLRSDTLDKYTQPDGRWLGQPKLKTNLTHDMPALKGAENVVLPGVDHLEVSYGPEAFARTYEFITGRVPGHGQVVAERAVVLDGKVTGLFADGTPTNMPLANARLEVFEVSPESGVRLGEAAYSKVVGADGRWGPFSAKPAAFYEFVVMAEGYATTHAFRSPFPRSSMVVHFRPGRLGEADRKAGSIVAMVRRSGFLGPGRDRMSLDGAAPPGLAPGVPGETTSTLRLAEAAPRSVLAELNGERIVVRTWPAKDNHLVRADFH